MERMEMTGSTLRCEVIGSIGSLFGDGWKEPTVANPFGIAPTASVWLPMTYTVSD
jgi:hypothetical protein